MEGERREEQEARIQAHVRLPPDKYTKAGPKDRAMKRPRSPIRQEHQERPKQMKAEAKGRELQKSGTIREFHNIHILLTLLATLVHLARQVFR
jgi:hypothetical protein